MRLIDADALKADYGMKDNCKDCEKELRGYVRQCEYDAVYTKMDFCGWIDSMPTIEPESKWIPVSERLPEYYEPVLTWDGHCYFVEKRIPTIKADNGEPIRSDWWVSDDYDEFDSDYYPNLRDGACIAWMPLPEPYREEGGER